MKDLSKIISLLNLGDLMLKYSQNKKELKDTVINYHPQNIDNYYKDVLPTKLTIAEFILDDNTKQKIENDLKLIFDKLGGYKSSFKKKENVINFENDNVSFNFVEKNRLKKEDIDELLKNIIKSIPTKAFIIKSDNVLAVLNQYDKIKQELRDMNSNNLVFKPKNIMYDVLSTIYNIERDINKVNGYAQEKFIKPFKVDLYGVSNKDFLKNAYYDPKTNRLVLGTVFNLGDQSIINASNDTDVVIHELGHKLLDDLRPNYLNNYFHFESGAVHEAFGDINAFLAAASDPNVKQYIKDNNIDLSKSNILSQIAEYFGKTIYTNIKQTQELLNKNPYMPKEELKNIKDEKPIRDLSKDFEYKKYSNLKNDEKEVHLQSKSLSNAFYKAFINFYNDKKDKYDLNQVAEKFYDIFIKGTKISNPATATIPEFMKSLIVADILFNDSELTPYLLNAANENKIFDSLNIDSIFNEIKESKNLNIEPLKIVLNNKYLKKEELENSLKEAVLKILKNYSKDFDYLTLNDLSVSLVPGFNNGINMEISYKYPKSIKVNNKNVAVYGGAILVLDKNLNLIYSYIENISDQKIKDMQDYANLIFNDKNDEDFILS